MGIGFGVDGETTLGSGARITAASSAAWTSNTSTPASLVFYTTSSGSTTPLERLRIDASGNVIVTGIGGLGYGTGSGGAVTQTISRTTGVTLNKTNGAITLFTAAGSSTPTSFTVTNSTVTATDTVVVSVKSSANVYAAFVTAVSGSSFVITFYALSGTASDTPVFNFAVIKAAIA
jgi:hypothetical protein